MDNADVPIKKMINCLLSVEFLWKKGAAVCKRLLFSVIFPAYASLLSVLVTSSYSLFLSVLV